MPKPEEEKAAAQEGEKKDPETVENEDGSVVIDVGEGEGEETPKEETTKKEEEQKGGSSSETKPDDAEARKRNAFYASQRIRDRQVRDLQEENKRLKAEQSKPEITDSKAYEDYESDLGKKPVSTIVDIAKQEAVKAVQAANQAEHMRVQQENAQRQADANSETLERNKAEVLGRHQEIDDPNSIKHQTMLEILERKPDYRTNPYGPILAERDLEKALEQKGASKKSETSIEDEKQRFAKANAASTPASRNLSGKKSTVTLTKDDVDFCKEHSINPKTFVANKVAFAKKGGEVAI